ncbi:MAG: hypothetical protein HY962_09220, partial [Ignavibacteriae bacterium]|nr:hypothetical protein [Ignavibacteriota bacterium]
MSRRLNFAALFSLVLLIAATTQLLAQTPSYSVSGGTGGNAIPFNPNGSMSSFSRWQGFYMPGQFTGAYAGNITHVYFRVYTASNQPLTTYTNLKISLGQLSGTTYPTTWHTGMTQAFFQASYTVPATNAGNWFVIQLQTPFPYNPANSLVIEVCSDGTTTGGITISTFSNSSPPNLTRVYGGSGCSGTVAGSSQTRTDFGFDLASPNFNDAGLSALLSPVNFCAGNYDIQVKLMNFGKQNLTSTTIKWTYDGVPESDYSWSGNLAPLSETTITLGSKNFAAGVNHPFKAWTHMPNNVPDTGVFNDTLKANLKPALSGTFTIGGATPNYATFAAAVADLVANGVCGP